MPLVFLGGALGAGLREALVLALPAHPLWIVLAVNVLGAFVLAALYERVSSPRVRLLFGTGVCGGFTTYSTFAVQNLDLLRDGRLGLALAYAVMTLVGGALATLAGLRWGARP